MNLTTRQRAACVCASATALFASGPIETHQPGADSRTGHGQHVRVELITDRATPGPGMRLGLKFDLDPGWHIYWQNPGDSGGPPEAAWTLPSAIMSAGIEWPAPERIDIGGLVNYGYHGSVVLPVVVGVASGARIPRVFTAKASLRWLACANVCISGKAELELKYPLNAEESRQVPRWSAAIDAFRDRLPEPTPASWKAWASSAGEMFVVEVMTGSREDEAVFFPLQMSQVNDSAAQAVTPLPNGVRLVLKKSSQLVGDPQVLTGLLSLSRGRTYTIEAPMK
jgi:DsbC/DsbD-like thiol-disulfide interchange protein